MAVIVPFEGRNNASCKNLSDMNVPDHQIRNVELPFYDA